MSVGLADIIVRYNHAFAKNFKMTQSIAPELSYELNEEIWKTSLYKYCCESVGY